MDIDKQAAQIRNKIEKLHYQLNSGQAFSTVKRKQKENEIAHIVTNLKALEQ